MHCGSGWEIDGANPWGRGFDVMESPGTMTRLLVDGCYAYDSLQSGFYNEGNYDTHPQSISGIIRNSHAENSGIRIAEASISGTPLIVGLDGREYPAPTEDVYGDGYWISGDIELINNTSRNNIYGFTVQDARIDGFQDEGSYFGGALQGGTIEDFVSVSAKVFALVTLNAIRGNIAVVGFDSPGRKPVMFNWMSASAQVRLHPRSYLELETNNGAVLLTDGQPATTHCRFARSTAACSFATSVSPALLIEVDERSCSTFDNCVDGWYGSMPTRANVTVRQSAAIATRPLPPAYPR